LSRRLQNNPEQSLFVEAPQVGSKWLGLANHRLVMGKGLCKGLKPPIGIDIINDDRSTRLQSYEGPIDLKAYILFTMQAVMDKDVDLAKLRK
jgi:hypothetical protein